MATFGLVHGAWHGAWCWAFLVPELELLGHKAVAVDLPIETATTPADWARHAADAFDGDEPPIIVGHSMAGIVIPLVADMIAVRGLVYVAAVLRRPGYSLADDNEAGVNLDISVPGSAADVRRDGEGYSFWVTPSSAIQDFYQDCRPAEAAWAFTRLRKQRAYWADRSPQTAWPPVPAASVVCTDDRMVNPAWQRRVARDWLKVEPIDFPGGHSPFMARPKEFAGLLDRLACTTFA